MSKKYHPSIYLVALFSIFEVIVILPSLSYAYDVGGIINTNTTWNLTNSPYNIISNIQVAEGITLTINPGVVVNGPGDSQWRNITIWGNLVAIGTPEENITFNHVEIGNAHDNGSSNIQYSDFYYGQILSNSEVLILKNSKLDRIQVYAGGYSIYIENNIFFNSEIIFGAFEPSYVRNNVFYRYYYQNESLYLGGGNAPIEYNSFLTKDKVDVRMVPGMGPINFNLSNNYWNTTDRDVIDAIIWDRNDDLNIGGYVNYLPILNSSHPDTPNFVYIPGDFSPTDCDVDGSDLAVLIANTSLIDLTTFAENFGENDCP